MTEYRWVERPDDGAPDFKVQRPRFYVDQGIPESLIRSIDARGLKVRKSTEDLPAHASDDQVLRVASGHDMILLTKDMDFWDDRKHPNTDTSGIVIINTDERRIEATFWYYYDFICRFTKAEWAEAKGLFNQEEWRFKRGEWFEEKRFKIGEDGKLYEWVRVDD